MMFLPNPQAQQPKMDPRQLRLITDWIRHNPELGQMLLPAALQWIMSLSGLASLQQPMGLPQPIPQVPQIPSQFTPQMIEGMRMRY